MLYLHKGAEHRAHPPRIEVASAVLREGLPDVLVCDHIMRVLPAQAEELWRLAPQADCDLLRLLADGRLPLPEVRRSLQSTPAMMLTVIARFCVLREANLAAKVHQRQAQS